MKTLEILQAAAPLIDNNASRYENYALCAMMLPIFILGFSTFAFIVFGEMASNPKKYPVISKICTRIKHSKLLLRSIITALFIAFIASFVFAGFAHNKSEELEDQAVTNITSALDSKYGVSLNEDLEFYQISKITGPLSATTSDNERIQITFEIDNNTDVLAFNSGTELPTKD